MSLKKVLQLGNIIKYTSAKDLVHGVQASMPTSLSTKPKYVYESWSTWIACENSDSHFMDTKQHTEAIQFWSDMKTLFQGNLGWIHGRTLNSCEHLSLHSAELGLHKEPVQFSRVGEFIHENISEFDPTAEWNREAVISSLLKIVHLSKNDEGKATQASNAMTLLNFMNVSFNKMDFSNVHIPDANLSHSVIDGADFTGANLEGVNFCNATLGDCIFNGASMKKVHFGAPITELKGHTGWVETVCGIEKANGDRWLASAGRDKTIRIWDVSTGSMVKTLEGHTATIYGLCYIPDTDGKEYIASGGQDKSIRLWDLNSGKLDKILGYSDGEIYALCRILGPNDEKWIASGGDDMSIRIWDVTSGNLVKIIKGHMGYVGSLCGMKGSEGEDWVVSGSSDKTIRVWDLKTGSQVMLLEGHTDSVFGICSVCGPHGEKWLASGSDDRKICIWDIQSGRQVCVLDGHTDWITGMCSVQGPHGENWLASSSKDKTIRLWDIATGNQLKKLGTHHYTVTSICGMKGPNDEVLLASGSVDKKVHIWDLESGNQLHSIEHEDIVCTPAASHTIDGRMNSFQHPQTSIRPIKMTSSRKLEGGNIQLRDVQGLGHLDKMLLFSLGAVSFDKDFVDYCRTKKYTSYQAKMMSICYERGWGVEKNEEEAMTWKEKALESASTV